MAEESGLSKEVIKDGVFSAQSGMQALSFSDSESLAEEISSQGSNSGMNILREDVALTDSGTSTFSAVLPESSALHFHEQQLRQLRAQCIVFLAFRNGLAPKQHHLETALGTMGSREGD